MTEQLLLPAFESEIVTLDVSKINYTKELLPNVLGSTKFSVILSSIKEVGIIEPPVVRYDAGKYLLLDGHLRIQALKKLKIDKVDCLLSTDDESFTYNKHVNRLSNIQEHKMIVKAIERGVTPERLAKVLNLDVDVIMQRKNLLDGIIPEVAELLKDKIIPRDVFRYLKKMKPVRQLEAANLMVDLNNYSVKFARSIWHASTDKQLIVPIKRPVTQDMEKLERLETEIASVQEQYQIVEDGYGLKVLNLMLSTTYIKSLLANERVQNYLRNNELEIYQMFSKIIDMENLNI